MWARAMNKAHEGTPPGAWRLASYRSSSGLVRGRQNIMSDWLKSWHAQIRRTQGKKQEKRKESLVDTQSEGRTWERRPSKRGLRRNGQSSMREPRNSFSVNVRSREAKYHKQRETNWRQQAGAKMCLTEIRMHGWRRMEIGNGSQLGSFFTFCHVEMDRRELLDGQWGIWAW